MESQQASFKRQSLGFAHPELLIIAGIVVLIGVVLFSGVLTRNKPSSLVDESMPADEMMMEDADDSSSMESTKSDESTMKADAPLTNTYTHPSGATINYPDGWVLDDSSATPSIVYKDSTASNSMGNGAGVLIITSPLPAGADFSAFATASGESFGQQFGSGVGEAKSVTINGVQAYMFDFTFYQSGSELTANLYFIPGTDKAYALFVTAESTLFQKYESVLTKIVQSFKV